MTFYTLIVIAKALTAWVNVVMTISVILLTLWLSERVLYKICVDLLDLWKQYKQVKHRRSWVIEDGGGDEPRTN